MRLPPWLWRVCRSKWTTRLLIVSPFLLMAAILAFYGIANWYGTWALKREAAAMKAAGWPTTLEEARGPQPKPEEDVLEHPDVIRELKLSDEPQLRSVKRMAYDGVISGFSAKSKWSAKMDLARLSDVRQLAEPPRPHDSEAQVAEDLLAKLQPQSLRFDEMKDAFRRPLVGWADVSSKRLLPLHQWAQFASERARLRLASGDPSSAFEDAETMMTLIEFLYRGPLLVSYLIAEITGKGLHEVIWEGIKRQAWNDAQLARFQQRLQASGGAKHFREIIRGELAYGIQHASTAFDEFREEPEWDSVRTSLWEGTRHWNRDQIKEAFAQSWENIRPQGLRKLEAKEAFAGFREAGDWLVEEPGDRTAGEFHAYFYGTKRARLDAIQYARAIEKYFDAEIRRSLVVTGIALERYRLKHGTTPEKLEALVPEFLPEVPKDLCDGQSLRYQVLPEGSPHVWSIWPSGKDERGMPNRDRTRNTVWTTGEIPGLTEAAYNAK
jgi:hypothetical protein